MTAQASLTSYITFSNFYCLFIYVLLIVAHQHKHHEVIQHLQRRLLSVRVCQKKMAAFSRERKLTSWKERYSLSGDGGRPTLWTTFGWYSGSIWLQTDNWRKTRVLACSPYRWFYCSTPALTFSAVSMCDY